MDNLNITDKLNSSDTEIKDAFLKGIESKMHVKLDYEKKDIDYSWLPIFEDTCYYIDNILRNPKKFIVNEEEIVKIEQAKKVTVESIVHLTQHTNLIQKFDQDTKEVTPSKILNINKEESLDTYENRFIYTIIKMMDEFYERNVSIEPEESYLIDEKKVNYVGETKIGTEKVNIEVKMQSKNNSISKEKLVNGMTLDERLKKLHIQLSGFKESELYKILTKLHVSQVRPPIRRTNVILKNPNFQKAMELWNFLQNYTNSSFSIVKDNQDFIDTGYIRDEFNEAFLINYLTLVSLSKTKNSTTSKEYASLTVNKIISSILDTDETITQEDFIKIVTKEYKKAHETIMTRDNNISNILTKHLKDFNEYMKNIVKELD